MAYKIADRAKEWTTYAGIIVAGIAAVVPQLVPQSQWVHIWQDLQILLGAALMMLPQSAGTDMVENESLALLKAFTASLPTQYATALQPIISTLAAAAVKHPSSPAPILPPVGPMVPAVPVLPVTPPAPAPAPVPAAPVVVVQNAPPAPAPAPAPVAPASGQLGLG